MNLVSKCNLAEVHSDFNYTKDVCIGFDEDHQLIVNILTTYDDSPEDNHQETAIVSFAEATRLARKMDIRPTDIPYRIAQLIAKHYPGYECWSGSEVRERYDAVVGLLIQYGIRYRTVKKRGEHIS